jgi:hypothetical protein
MGTSGGDINTRDHTGNASAKHPEVILNSR